MQEKNTSNNKHYWLYALKLEQGKYYIGITARFDPQFRINQHISGYYGAKWTKLYKYIETLELIDLGLISTEGAEKEEKRLTLKYMNDFGYNNVRGADLAIVENTSNALIDFSWNQTGKL